MTDTQGLKVGQTYLIQIERLAKGGDGVGRVNGFVVFVPFSAPQDLVNIRVDDVRSRFARGHILDIVRPSPFRVVPSCSSFGLCGGCQWQHVDYSEQLRQKQQIIERAFSQAKIAVEEFYQIIPSPKVFHYRNRIQVQKRGSQVGFFQRKSHEFSSVEKCWIVEPAIHEAMTQLASRTELSGRLEILINQNGTVSIQSAGESDPIGGFSQINSSQNDNLVSLILNWAEKIRNSTQIIDLFAGAGNFSIPLAQKLTTSKVLAIESNALAVSRGRALAKNLDLQTRLIFREQKVDQFLRSEGACLSNSFVVLDPPRGGAGAETVVRISKTECDHVIYVSCDVQTLVRDLRVFKDSGFRIAKVQPLDMFPQTDHVEVAVDLQR